MTRALAIAYGNSCFAKTWSNKTTTWDELCARLSMPVRTPETVEEYPRLPKAERDRVKDKGGFVGGSLRGNRRKRESVALRSMLTLDADQAEVGFAERFRKDFRYAGCVYSTHGHTPEAPRLRVIIPLARDVTPDEYQAMARLFASEWGIDQFDECSYRPHQLMYWPTCPSNGEYIYYTTEGDFLDPDHFLTSHPGWKDCSLLPTSSRESVVRSYSGQKQGDPLTKSGVVGAFCRTYTMAAVMGTFLAGIYSPTDIPNRYDFIGSDSMPGVQIYDDRFSYSHHATDPACGMLLNAFDLVRIHKFGDDDPQRSFNQMSEYALQDKAVRLEMAKEKNAEAAQVFGEGANWLADLEVKKSGEFKETVTNLVTILRNDENLQGITFNLLKGCIDTRSPLPWASSRAGWTDSDTASLHVYIASSYGGLYAPSKTHDALLAVAAERAWHPIREYLDNLPEWDGNIRIDGIFSDYFGSEDTLYTRAVARKFFAAAVARIYQPGIKFDNVLILNGPQGAGKSTFFERLGQDWYSDSLSLMDMKDKTGAEKLQGYWILELSELQGIKKAEIETVKGFISRTDDKYRAAYGTNVESHPRQCVIVGSTNAENGFLRDVTGNRRFWPVKIFRGRGRKQAWEISSQEAAQIWAEAKHIWFVEHEKLYMDDQLTAELAEQAQMAELEQDERLGLIRKYLDTKLPLNWDGMDLIQRRDFLLGQSGLMQGTEVRSWVCNLEIWSECFGLDPAKIKRSDSYEITSMMQQLTEFEKDDRQHRIPLYGVQRGYRRA